MRRTPRASRPRLEVLEGRDVPSTLTVTNALDSGAGSLRAEIAAAGSKDTIVFASGLAGQIITLTTGELVIDKNLTITGPGAGQLTVSGAGMSRVFDVYSASQTIKVTLSGLTISDGNVEAVGSEGGGVYDGGETLVLSGCTLTGNRALNGGAIANRGGTVTVNGCTLSGNSADEWGGGIFNSGTMTVSNSAITGNSALTLEGSWARGKGGGAYNSGTLSLGGCTVSGNLAGEAGGGVFDYVTGWDARHHTYIGGQVTVTAPNVFSNNSPGDIVYGS